MKQHRWSIKAQVVRVYIPTPVEVQTVVQCNSFDTRSLAEDWNISIPAQGVKTPGLGSENTLSSSRALLTPYSNYDLRFVGTMVAFGWALLLSADWHLC